MASSKLEPLGDADLVAPDRQRPLRRLSAGSSWRIVPAAELRGFMKVDWPASARRSFSAREVGQRHVDLAAHLQQRRRLPVEPRSGIGADRAQVVGDVLADLAVAARRAALEDAVAVDQRDGQAVDLGLGDERRTRGRSIPSRARWLRIRCDPGAQLVARSARWPSESIGSRWATFSRRLDRLAADALGRRVGA